ncbi:MAG TPA: hypothetical protein VND21_08755 [Planctomycetota bacterium]|jgi:hypothetical protein|nr:hypothetical protein [Planctomycetota bacterium]
MTTNNALATAALVCAGAGFFVAAGWGFLLGLAAVVLGLLGFVKSISPRAQGGVLSLGAILLGVVLIVVKVIAGALHVLF